ncbi:MAG: ParB/RepB/Spo0J family partition protein [Bacilli bacterium]|nr:ParB/RepB/Spo0J family partition protein [Bacilli bacterium]
MDKRKALGRGLEQLFNNETLDINTLERNIIETADKKDIKEINLDELRSNPYQPRKTFDEDKLNELALSIKEYGVIEPIIVKKSIKGYEIVAGERRVKASRIAGLETIPAIIKDFNDEEMMQIALLENIQREDLNAIEEALAYKNIINSLNITQEEFSKKIGKSRSYVTNMIGLLRLPKTVQRFVLEKEISLGHAKVLSKLENTEQIIELAERIIKENMNVRTLEELVKNEEVQKIVPIKRKNVNPYNRIESVMREKIGTQVKVSAKKITIPFDSEKDLERILDILNINISSED